MDKIDEEQRYIREKFKHNTDLVDIKARENVKGLVKIALVLKYSCMINYYEERKREINRGIILVDCLRYSRVES